MSPVPGQEIFPGNAQKARERPRRTECPTGPFACESRPSDAAAPESGASAYLLETRPKRFAIGASSSGLAANHPATTTTMATMNQISPAHPTTSVPANM